MSERASLRSATLAVALSFVVALGIAEYVLRSFAPLYLTAPQGTFQYHTELGYRLKPGIHLYQLTDHLEEVRTNTLGTVNYVENFAGYPALVYTIGDSYTQGMGSSADATYPFQLDLLLNLDADGHYQERYGVVSLGLAAFGPEQALLALERYAKQIGKPDFILYFGCDNDAEDDLLFQSGYRHRHIVDGSPAWGVWVGPALWLSEFELVKRLKSRWAGSACRASCPPSRAQASRVRPSRNASGRWSSGSRRARGTGTRSSWWAGRTREPRPTAGCARGRPPRGLPSPIGNPPWSPSFGSNRDSRPRTRTPAATGVPGRTE